MNFNGKKHRSEEVVGEEEKKGLGSNFQNSIFGFTRRNLPRPQRKGGVVWNWGTGSNFLLKEKLRKTDWLIDQIVYKLYGFTP
jgi:hypothetical protein